MENIRSSDRVSLLMKEELKNRALTNAGLDLSRFERAARDGRLFCSSFGGFTLLAEDRGKFANVFFWLRPDADEGAAQKCAEELSELLNKPLVLEFAMRENDERAAAAVKKLEAVGFSEKLTRSRMNAEKGDPGDAVRGGRAENTVHEVLGASPSDLHEIYELFSSSYDMLTGCLPDEDELFASIVSGEVFCVRSEGKLAGALEIKRSRASEEVRHVAVSPGMKRTGIASSLIISRLSETKMTLWVNENNTAARSLYEGLGFKYAGQKSVVMIMYPGEEGSSGSRQDKKTIGKTITERN